MVRTRTEELITPREREVLKLIISGDSNTKIAEKLFISVHTDKAHTCRLLQKTQTKNRQELIVYALTNGLLNEYDRVFNIQNIGLAVSKVRNRYQARLDEIKKEIGASLIDGKQPDVPEEATNLQNKLNIFDEIEQELNQELRAA